MLAIILLNNRRDNSQCEGSLVPIFQLTLKEIFEMFISYIVFIITMV